MVTTTVGSDLRFRLVREDFADAVAWVARTLPTRPAVPVLAGVLMALSLFVFQRLRPRIIEVGQHPDGSLRDRLLWKLPPLAAHNASIFASHCLTSHAK